MRRFPHRAPVTKGGAEIGELISSHGHTAFALVRLDRLDEASGDVTAAQIPVALAQAGMARWSVGVSRSDH